MRRLARVLVSIIGVIFLLSGIMLLLWPKMALQFGSKVAVFPPGTHVTSAFYTLAAFALLMGLILFLSGIRKLVVYSTFVWVVGAIIIVVSILMLVHPYAFRDFENELLYQRSESFKMTIAYVAGIARLIVGYFLLMAGIKRPPVY